MTSVVMTRVLSATFDAVTVAVIMIVLSVADVIGPKLVVSVAIELLGNIAKVDDSG
jgi:hypothetical protein